MGLGDTVLIKCNSCLFEYHPFSFFFPKSIIALAFGIVLESKAFLELQLMRCRGCPLLTEKRNLHRFKCELNLHFYKNLS